MRENYSNLWHIQTSFGTVELLKVSSFQNSFSPHFHDFYGFGVIEEGALSFHYRGAELIAHTASILTANPDEVHDGSPASGQGYKYRSFCIDTAMLRKVAEELTGRPGDVPLFKEGVIHEDHLAQRIRQAHIAFENQSLSQLRKDQLLIDLLVELIQKHAVRRCPAPVVRGTRQAIMRVREYIEEHSSENMSLATLAKVAQLSPYYLSRSFRKEVGIPLQNYLTQVRMLHAKEFLKSGSSIIDAAQAAGFADQSHLTKWFKRIVGVTPGQYRPHAQ